EFDPNLDAEARAAHDAAAEFYELKYYQKMRIYTFLNPEADPRGSAWQTIQSMITVGSGGLSGKGYLQGTQTRLNYLPEHHTDFIFSLYAEERGFLGVVVIAGVYLAFLLRGLQFARDCPEMHGTLLAAGVVTILAFHIFVNIAITVGSLPVTGIPLPFMSYGGSFYMTTMMCVGVLLNVPMRRRMFVNE
ncbi:MAG TPA: FtsW/RodA/SpoVE family cell cycle protein, partial [Candidatus Hydrogenedentes bacterium]|nr:FtsW/RodA/SpoVE family cell cycle protein [Candidatus Hydrogenedentota bacterium]